MVKLSVKEVMGRGEEILPSEGQIPWSAVL